MALSPSNELEPGSHSIALPVPVERTEVVTADHLVAQAVAAQALAGAVADVVQTRPRLLARR